MSSDMSKSIQRLYKRNSFSAGDVKYITHGEQKTHFHLLDGRDITTSFPLKAVLSQLPEHEFWSIQKGVVVAARQIVNIDKNAVYTMSDGHQFKGRGRTPSEHKGRRLMLEATNSGESSLPQITKEALLEKCTLMEQAPIAFCVIELTNAERGQGFDFIFQYCNREMSTLFSIPKQRMVGHSFYGVFPKIDLKWIVTYADVALNGTRSSIDVFIPELQKVLTISCFQPSPGFCACFLSENISGTEKA